MGAAEEDENKLQPGQVSVHGSGKVGEGQGASCVADLEDHDAQAYMGKQAVVLLSMCTNVNSCTMTLSVCCADDIQHDAQGYEGNAQEGAKVWRERCVQHSRVSADLQRGFG